VTTERSAIVPFALAFLALACASKPAPPRAATPAARAAIDSQFSKLFDAYRRRDGAGFAAIYAPDAEMHSPEGTLSGRVAIQADMQHGLASVVAVTDDSAVTDDFLATDDQAIQVGHIVWTETDLGKAPARTRLTFAFTWRKAADGVWRIARDLNYETPVK
jgi:uncharacterized protein (TIGR02246 family)